MTQLEAGLEAVLFAAGDAVPVERLAAALEVSSGELMEAAAALENLYDFENRGLMLLRLEDKLQATFFIGFAAAMAGIVLISFNGASIQLNPVGDLLALLAAFVWACYSILTRKISALGYHTILNTRRTFFYGILFMLPALFLSDLRTDLSRFTQPVYLSNLLFLGLCASALCFVTWNTAVKLLGAVKTCVYSYLVPVITVTASVLILHEPFTWVTGAGMPLALAGLVLSEYRPRRTAAAPPEP